MSDATTPADPTDQIATVAATLAVAPDAQQHDQAVDEVDCPRCSLHRLYELTERLEAERDALLAEHEAVWAYRDALYGPACLTQRDMMFSAHDNAERVLHQD